MICYLRMPSYVLDYQLSFLCVVYETGYDSLLLNNYLTLCATGTVASHYNEAKSCELRWTCYSQSIRDRERVIRIQKSLGSIRWVCSVVLPGLVEVCDIRRQPPSAQVSVRKPREQEAHEVCLR